MNDFLARLRPFLKKLPKDHKFAVEIRNKSWLVPPFVEALREQGVALALIDQSWMPRPAQWFEKFDPITADFTYVRWLGDRKGIEEQTKVWNKVIVDRSAELSEWANLLENIHQRKVPIYAYANNHYAGYGPATVDMFRNLWRKQVAREDAKPERGAVQGRLFRVRTTWPECFLWRRRLAGSLWPSTKRKNAGETPAPQNRGRSPRSLLKNPASRRFKWNKITSEHSWIASQNRKMKSSSFAPCAT